MNLQSDSEESIKTVITLQELKQAVSALENRCEALEEVVPKLQNE